MHDDAFQLAQHITTFSSVAENERKRNRKYGKRRQYIEMLNFLRKRQLKNSVMEIKQRILFSEYACGSQEEHHASVH